MALLESLIESDPVLQRVFFDTRRFAPMPNRTAIVNIFQYEITELKRTIMKAKTIDVAEPLQRLIRSRWFAVRRHCDGYYLELPAGHNDGCEHVALFSHESMDGVFRQNLRARAALWHRYAGRLSPAR